EMAKQELGADSLKNQYLEVDSKQGVVKTLRGREGIRKYNVIISFLNIRIGQYRGNLWQKHWKSIYKELGEPCSDQLSKREVNALKKKYPQLGDRPLPVFFDLLARITRYPSFPELPTVQEIQEAHQVRSFLDTVEKEIDHLITEA